jgi:hypothetical protein
MTRRMAWRFGFLLLALGIAGAARAGVTPDPGGAGAWGAGGALLADRAGALLVFDAPARLDPGGARLVLSAQRMRLFELDALARVRVAVGVARAPWAAALGFESFGPAVARRTRLVCGAALAGQNASIGAAWNERRGPLGTGHAGALDAAVSARVRERVSFQLSVRGLLAGGDPDIAADPDWTFEVAGDLGPARAHLARTRDLHGARTGGGVALAAGPLAVHVGALGPPLSWTIGLLLGASRARGGAHAGFARVVHPVLGASDTIEGGVTW